MFRQSISFEKFVEAVRAGDMETLQQFIAENRANLTEIDRPIKYKRTALILAAYNGHINAVQALLDAGANVDTVCRSGYTALTLATENKKTAMVQALLAAGANVDIATYSGDTALMLAAKNGMTAAVKMLLDSGADVNSRNKHNLKIALMYAAYNGFIDTVQLLLTAGADVNAVDDNGYTALIYALHNNHNSIARMLLINPCIDLYAHDQGLKSINIA